MASSATALPEHFNGHRALEWRARLYARRPVIVRRHALRIGSRAAVLLAGDISAVILARALLRAVLFVVAPAATADWLQAGPLAAPGHPASLVFPVALFISLAVTGSYGRYRAVTTALRVGGAVMLAVVVSTTALAAIFGVGRALALASLFGAFVFASILAIRVLSESFLARVWPRDRWASPAIVVTSEDDSPAAQAIRTPGGKFRVVSRVAPGAHLPDSLRETLAREEIETIAVCETLPPQQARAILEVALGAGCHLLYPARALDIEGMHPRLVWHGDQTFQELGPIVLRPGAVVAKRITDVIGSAILLVLTAPLMLLITIAIRLDSSGPVLFAQDRAGIGGRRFRMLKFRTMRVGADEEKKKLAHLNVTGDVRLFKIPSDPRITRLGHTLRRWSLDELPQLWNVLRGDMSLIGPRPFFESDFAAYDDHHFRRLDAKPGLTGLWQVSGRSDVVDFEEVIFLDRQYIERWSFWLDLSILLRTIPTVMRRVGAF